MRRFSPGKKRFCACFFLGISGFLCVSTSQTFLFEENGLQKQACWHICGCTHGHRPEKQTAKSMQLHRGFATWPVSVPLGYQSWPKQLIASFYQSTSRLVLEKHRPTKSAALPTAMAALRVSVKFGKVGKLPSLVECSNVRCGDLQ